MPFQYHHIHLNAEREFIDRAGAELERTMTDSVEKRGICVLGLSGGSTPRAVYEKLGQSQVVDWSKVTAFLVDERYVPANDEGSNQRLIWNALLKNTDIGAVVFPNTGFPIEECARDYGERLPDGVDVVVLGMGEDGHIASLFPGDTGALREQSKRVLHTTTDVFAIHDRITVTVPILTGAQSIVFLLKGANKKRVFEEVIEANVDPMRYPAHSFLETGRTTWITQW